MTLETQIEIHEKEPEGFSCGSHATGCYLEIDGRVLLLQYAPPKRTAGRWDVPGGRVEKGESPEEGARRELFEETGILVDASQVERVLALFIRKPDIDYIYYMFRVQMDYKPSVILSSEHQNYQWATLEEFQQLPLVERSLDALDLYFKALKSCLKT